MECNYRQFVLLETETDWNNYLAKAINKVSVLNLITEPSGYPCLVTLIEVGDKAEFCFVYPQDARLLVSASVKDTRQPEYITTFTLAMFLELQAVGAVKQDKFEKALAFLGDNEKLLKKLSRKETLTGLLAKISEAYNQRTE